LFPLALASAERLADEGARLVIVDIDGEGAQRVANTLPTEAIAFCADVSDEDQVDGYITA
jgi:NAD(P)-dependent dehydrogenase (short-subunit alcohol dehydrogenase family)